MAGKLFTWSGLGIGVVAAVAAAAAIAYIGTNMGEDRQPVISPAPGTSERRTPQPPPKIDFLGLAPASGSVAPMPKGLEGDGAPIGADDAAVVWLKVTRPGAPGGAASGGAAGGRRGRMNLSLTLKDDAGQDFSTSVQRVGPDLIALHIKKGYDHQPKTLTLSQMDRDKELASWKIESVPAPKRVMPDGAPDPLGVVRFSTDERGRTVASVHLAKPIGADQGIMLQPLSTAFLALDSTGSTPLVARIGEGPADLPIEVPNLRMGHEIAFDTTTFGSEAVTEKVSFKTGRIDNRFGQPVFVVDADEKVKTPSGILVTLPKQDFGPKREPRKIHPQIEIRLKLDGTGLTCPTMPQLQPLVHLKMNSPSPESLGLQQIVLTPSPSYTGGLYSVFSPQPMIVMKAPAGMIHFGPAPMELTLTIYRAKLLSKRRVVLAVDPKVSAQPVVLGGAPVIFYSQE